MGEDGVVGARLESGDQPGERWNLTGDENGGLPETGGVFEP